MNIIFLTCVLLCLTNVVFSSVWSANFIPQAFRQAVKSAESYSSLSMVATFAKKISHLDKIKERYSGRPDIDSDAEENADISSYDSFVEADKEEVDPPVKGQIITGTVIEMDDNGALLEIGGKMSGYIPIKEAALIPVKHVNAVLEIGQSVTAECVGTLKGMPVLSIRASQLVFAWENILNIRASDTPFDVKVLEVNKGGAVCAAFGLKAFLPGSHFLGVPDESLIGQTLTVKFLEVNEEDGKLVVSQRKAKSDSLSFDFKKYSLSAGVITGLRPYGAFVELEGGVSGLLHISQISYDRIDNVESVLTVGQKVKVMIIDHDKMNNRVALSTKSLEPNPGDMLKDMESVFTNAEETAKKYLERMEEDRRAREAAAKDIVAGLGGALDESGVDPLVSVADSIESILASIVADAPVAAQ